MATTYFGWTLPTVGADADAWGTLLNAVFTSQDTVFAAPANTIKGNNTGSTAAPVNLTATQATAMFNAFGGDSGSGGLKGLVPATVAGDKRKVLTGAGTWQAGYGRAFGCVITSTSVNGSTPTIAATMNIASISNVTENAGIAYADLTFTDAMPSTSYAVHVSRKNPVGEYEGYDNTATGSVRIYWGAQSPAIISVSGFI
jgi:hypothetical protein